MWTLIVLLLSSFGGQGLQLCVEPDPVVNSYRYDDDEFLEADGWLNYTCYINYILWSGSLTRQCQPNGIFSHQAPQCVYSCGAPPNITDMEIEVPEPSLDGSIARYTCTHNPAITFHAVCSRNLNRWDYNYTSCPHNGNIYAMARKGNIKDILNFQMVTDGNPLTCRDMITSNTPRRKFWFNQNMDIISFNITFGSVPDDLDKMVVQMLKKTSDFDADNASPNVCGGSYTDLDDDDVIHVECPHGTYGKILHIEAILNNGEDGSMAICEVYIRGNYRNESCTGPFRFRYGAEVFFTPEPQTRCLPGFYHHKGVDGIPCDEDTLQWESTYIRCNPEDELTRITTSNPNQTALFDLQDATCVTLPIGMNTIVGRTTTPGQNIIIKALSMKFVDSKDRKDFITDDVFRMDDVPLQPSCVSLPTSTKTLQCSFDPPAKGQEIKIVQNVTSAITLCEVHVIGYNKAKDYECYTGATPSYQGQMNHTIYGHVCERWDGVPASLSVTFDYLPDPTPTHAENYCRDPDNRHTRPWCFIKNYTEEQLCPIVGCEENCFKERYGTDFAGTLNVTATGATCIKWEDVNRNASIENAESYQEHCRNPGNSYSSPWCYTDVNGTFERCDNVHCPKQLQDNHYRDSDYSHLLFPICYWFQETEISRAYRVNITDDWLRPRNIQNDTYLYCLGLDDMTLHRIYINNYDPESSSTTATTTETSTEPTTTSTTTRATTGSVWQHTTILNPRNVCSCRCNMEPSLLTYEVTEARIAQINKELNIEKGQLTSTIRKMTSAYDERPSATYLGSSALAIFSCAISLIVLPDLFKVIYHLHLMFKDRLQTSNRK